jgi:hypothetical protein
MKGSGTDLNNKWDKGGSWPTQIKQHFPTNSGLDHVRKKSSFGCRCCGISVRGAFAMGGRCGAQVRPHPAIYFLRCQRVVTVPRQKDKICSRVLRVDDESLEYTEYDWHYGGRADVVTPKADFLPRAPKDGKTDKSLSYVKVPVGLAMQ